MPSFGRFWLQRSRDRCVALLALISSPSCARLASQSTGHKDKGLLSVSPRHFVYPPSVPGTRVSSYLPLLACKMQESWGSSDLFEGHKSYQVIVFAREIFGPFGERGSCFAVSIIQEVVHNVSWSFTTLLRLMYVVAVGNLSL
jgi:hypothetical protein